MLKQLSVKPGERMAQPATEVALPTKSSKTTSPRLSVTKAVERLLSLCPPLDVAEPEAFIAGIAAIFTGYPDEVLEQAVAPQGIPARLKALRNLAAITEVCDELYEPVSRRIERERIANQPRALPAPPRSPELQAEIDRQIENWRRARA